MWMLLSERAIENVCVFLYLCVNMVACVYVYACVCMYRRGQSKLYTSSYYAEQKNNTKFTRFECTCPYITFVPAYTHVLLDIELVIVVGIFVQITFYFCIETKFKYLFLIHVY